MWPNLLALCAPAVAVAWQALLGNALGVGVSWPLMLLLGLAVWWIYLSDRLLDALKVTEPVALTARHRFCYEHQSQYLVLWLVATGVLAALLWAELSRPLLRLGVAVGCGVMMHFAAVHLLPQRLRRFWPKEASTGLFFSAGSSVPVFAFVPMDIPVLAVAGGFAVVCTLNCLLIEYSEWQAGAEGAGAGHWTHWAGERVQEASLVFGMCCWAVALLLGNPLGVVWWALGAGSMGLWLLARWKQRISLPAVRVMADYALLAPMVAGAVVRWLVAG